MGLGLWGTRVNGLSLSLSNVDDVINNPEYYHYYYYCYYYYTRFCPTDTKFVTASDDSTLKIWSFNDGTEERVLTGHGWDVKCVDWHPYKCLVASGGKDSLIKLWDPKAGKAITTVYVLR